jgi:hypothetical protein
MRIKPVPKSCRRCRFHRKECTPTAALVERGLNLHHVGKIRHGRARLACKVVVGHLGGVGYGMQVARYKLWVSQRKKEKKESWISEYIVLRKSMVGDDIWPGGLLHRQMVNGQASWPPLERVQGRMGMWE